MGTPERQFASENERKKCDLDLLIEVGFEKIWLNVGDRGRGRRGGSGPVAQARVMREKG